VHYIPVNVMCRKQLAEIETRGLFQEFRLGCMRRIVTEGDEHDARQIDDLSIDLEHLCCGLNLGLEAVGWGAEPAQISRN